LLEHLDIGRQRVGSDTVELWAEVGDGIRR